MVVLLKVTRFSGQSGKALFLPSLSHWSNFTLLLVQGSAGTEMRTLQGERNPLLLWSYMLQYMTDLFSDQSLFNPFVRYATLF